MGVVLQYCVARCGNMDMKGSSATELFVVLHRVNKSAKVVSAIFVLAISMVDVYSTVLLSCLQRKPGNWLDSPINKNCPSLKLG